jgi:co-chaperonin GroES (HSP10)
MQAIGKYIIISIIEEEIMTDSGIILSGEDAKQFRYKKGQVKNPGTDVSFIKEGDVIYFDKGHSFTMMIDNHQFTIIREVDVVVVC